MIVSHVNTDLAIPKRAVGCRSDLDPSSLGQIVDKHSVISSHTRIASNLHRTETWHEEMYPPLGTMGNISSPY